MTSNGWIDVNAELGPAVGRAAGAPLERLRAERDRHALGVSLVRSRPALLGDTHTGNAALLDACDGDAGLLPVAVLSPEKSDGADRAMLRDRRFVAFWLEGRAAPTGASAAVDDLVRAAAGTGRPLFVRIERFGDATAVGRATADLGVPVVLVGAHYDNIPDTLAAAVRYPHLHIETSSLAHLAAIETAVRHIGAERVLFGTGAPRRASQSAINAISVARISNDDKRLILGGNAARLLGLGPQSIAMPSMRRPARAIDAHAHLGPLSQDVPFLAAGPMLQELHRQSATEVAIASSVEAIETDSEAGNQALVAACASTPGLLGYLLADPTDVAAAADQIRRWGDAPGIVGIKIGCEQSLPTASAGVWDLFNVLADYGRPVKIHNDGAGWDTALQRIAAAHPRLPIIVAHGGLGSPSAEGAALTETVDNIYLEMSSSFADLATVRDVARRVPEHKFLFGTDAPLLEPAFILGTYQDAELPTEREAAVYYDNAARLFGIE